MSLSKHTLIYDGQCPFCRKSIQQIKRLDWFNKIIPKDFHQVEDLKSIHEDLNESLVQQKVCLVDSNGVLTSGFDAARRATTILPLLFIFVPLLYIPGIRILGVKIYFLVAKNRYTISCFLENHKVTKSQSHKVTKPKNHRKC